MGRAAVAAGGQLLFVADPGGAPGRETLGDRLGRLQFAAVRSGQLIPKAPLSDSYSRIASGLIQVGAEDSRHAISGQIARGLFGEGASGVGPVVEGCQPEPAASVAGRGPRRDGPRLGGEDRGHGPANATRLGPALQRFGSGRPHRQLDGGSQASPFGGATGSVRADRRGRSGSSGRRRRALAADRPQARHCREVRRRVSSALCRKASAEAWLLPYQCAAPSSGSGRADRRGFQKNFPHALKAHLDGLPETTPVEIWFEDEARIGQKNGQVRQWARRGTRPRQPADQRYDNAYLFGAICPARGVGAALALPYADAAMMQLHLNEISRNVAVGAHAVLLLDRAGWHTTSKLDVPANITPIFLPSRAPELNPVENVWQYLRQNWLSNTVFENYDAIIDAACAAWRKLIAQPETITSIGMREWAHVGQPL